MADLRDNKKVRHILSLSGGKDSAALAVHMRGRVEGMEYIFHDTGKELPETYEYLDRLEAYLGVKIVRTTFGTTFDDLLRRYGGMLPSNNRRWCTKMMKLKPFEDYVGSDPCINYIAIRADEDRVGYISHKPNIKAIFPFRDEGISYPDVIRILKDSGIGLPPFMEWGRSRSGCYFCFYQQKIEWVRLKHKHPDYYEMAKAYEKPNRVNANIFFWCKDESLESLERPERTRQIIENWKKTQERERGRRKNIPLAAVLAGMDFEPPTREGCLICQL
ncbi:phosphoadenosine phosphosulfate reductase family protein [Desulforhabdus sp. TSK]|uniref:phosphoadenosine phosphosulfate reductase family protein n=1 Tax=Desulforhabdus sp. TSK TaxID=2925014 RepID=UPI001FC8733C|nr:phosphoadenosine phosphosulfate reductase family protein [Desulforhabdus sp. TSK]GKT08380.1 phosphoadenosine phosphosulfate reductase [Desulforhabdus sp. TSK]